jgi:peptide deformylase
MSLKELLVYPNPILRETSEIVDGVGEDIGNLIDDMAETMYASRGIGLAAIQIGIPKRVIVIDVGEGLVALINPEICNREGESQMEEGCLCLPGVMVDVTRSERVTVKGLDGNGEEITIDAEGLFARALQHEIEHLDGILIVDKVSRIKRELLTSALRKQAKERTAAEKKS